MGQPAAGLPVLAEALTFADKTGERFYEPELHRLRGALLLQQSADNHGEAQVCFHRALDVARSLQARSFELRTATSLSRLWQQQGKRHEARLLLNEVQQFPLFSLLPLSPPQQNSLTVIDVFIKVQPG